MYKHVLIPAQLDDSRDMEAAEKAAQKLVSPDGKITILHVIEPLPYNVEAYLPERFPSESRAALKSRLEEIAGHLPNAEIALTNGSAGRSITDWANTHDVDCITIPSHQPVLADVILGSTAAWVVRHATCAVHVVR